MRWGAALLVLAGCSSSSDDVIPISLDASDDSTVARDAGDISFPDVITTYDAWLGPTFNGGGPLACGSCTCDGTLYACLGQAASPNGGCPSGGGPPLPPMPFADDAGASDASWSCGLGVVCSELPVTCLPKPTCDCITKATGLQCTVAPNGNGFILACPPPPP